MTESTIEVDEAMAIRAAEILATQAEMGYRKNDTRRADIHHALARSLNENSRVEWTNLRDKVNGYEDIDLGRYE